MSFDKIFFETISKSVNFERRYEKSWREAECDGDYKSIGLLHYAVDEKCNVQVWHDKITGSKRWWFGFSFPNKSSLDNFIIKYLPKLPPHYNENGFNNDWLMDVVSEKWKGETRYYLGIYSKRGKENKAIDTICELANKGNDIEYIKLNRKYGEGEGKDHFELKNYIFENPNLIGLGKVKDKFMEYPFTYTGDRVDLMFILETGEDVVVEIETNNALPGCHQAVKYKALRCAEKGRVINDKKIIPCLVAWKVPKIAKEFCDYYGIRYYEIKP